MKLPLPLTTEQRIRQFVRQNGWTGEKANERIGVLLKTARLYPFADIISLHQHAFAPQR